MSTSDSLWGAGYRAAISLTYDDGIPNHLDLAITMLEAHGFRGTFYVVASPENETVCGRLEDWRAAFRRGHEIGNHSACHPGWKLKPDHPPTQCLEHMDADAIEREVASAAAWLDEQIGPDPGRTYAYPYAQNYIGPDREVEPYARAVRRHCAASRLGGGDRPNAPETDPFALRGFSFGAGATAEQLIGYAEHALRTGGWALLDFHGIGGPWIETPAAAHQALLDWLAGQPIRVAPVRDLVACLR